jgi:hypothetical protein
LGEQAVNQKPQRDRSTWPAHPPASTSPQRSRPRDSWQRRKRRGRPSFGYRRALQINSGFSMLRVQRASERTGRPDLDCPLLTHPRCRSEGATPGLGKRADRYGQSFNRARREAHDTGKQRRKTGYSSSGHANGRSIPQRGASVEQARHGEGGGVCYRRSGNTPPPAPICVGVEHKRGEPGSERVFREGLTAAQELCTPRGVFAQDLHSKNPEKRCYGGLMSLFTRAPLRPPTGEG